MDDKFYPTPTITIPIPRHSIQPRGTNTTKTTSPQRSIRFADEEYLTVQDAATMLGMGKADFVRWCALAVANDIIRQHTLFERGLSVTEQPPTFVPQSPPRPYPSNITRDPPGRKPTPKPKKLSDMIAFNLSRKEVI